VFLFGCSNGAAFWSGEILSFLDFLSGSTEIVGVIGSMMLQRQKYSYCLLQWQIHCQIIMLFCYGNYCAIFIYLLIIFTVIKYFVILEIKAFLE
jgi:hypothetical protein